MWPIASRWELVGTVAIDRDAFKLHFTYIDNAISEYILVMGEVFI